MSCSHSSIKTRHLKEAQCGRVHSTLTTLIGLFHFGATSLIVLNVLSISASKRNTLNWSPPDTLALHVLFYPIVAGYLIDTANHT